ncbi:btb/poz domain-containing [Anaeramoeba ignava]|uniref:Btb/poz domain-containing n=1 Tax=Anaeramoeba ignava TaxID=1746090 RepID=A0A9Q0L5N4_ANAIG|nr:btb/poz domain-containing [Anaeramoeba ignava]
MIKNTETIDQVLQKLFNNSEISDVVFSVGKNKEKIYGHKTILATSSRIWHKLLFPEKWKEKKDVPVVEMEIPNYEPATVKVVLEFSYTRKPHLNWNFIMDVLKFAKEFEMNDLVVICFDFIQSNLLRENCLHILNNKKLFQEFPQYAESTKHHLYDFIQKNGEKIFEKRDCFVGLTEETVTEVLNMKFLSAAEIKVFNSLVEWGKWICQKNNFEENQMNLRNCLKNLLPLIRLDVMSPKCLEVVQQSQLYPLERIVDILFNVSKKQVHIEFASRLGGPVKRRKIKKRIEELKIALLVANDNINWSNDVKKSIESTGIKDVEILFVCNETPTIEKLMQFDGIFTYSYFDGYQDPIQIGNNLAEYVESGKGLVVGSSVLIEDVKHYILQGRIAEESFFPVTRGVNVSGERHKLGDIVDQDHPIIQGVRSFDGGKNSAHISSDLDPNAKLIAKWDNGNHLVSEKRMKEGFGIVVVLNIWPVSNKVNPTCWLSSSDGARLIANAVEYVANN